MDMAAIEGRTSADTIYAIDRVADDTLVDWFERTGPASSWCRKASTKPVVIGADPQWTVIVDSIDGTRGLMYDKRAGVVPRRGGAARRLAARRRRPRR